MDFPILEITDDRLAEQWLQKYFHPTGLPCPRCGASVQQSALFEPARRRPVTAYRCRHCRKVYTVYAGTLFANKHLRPTQVILLLRGICKGSPPPP
jgi:transposase-like protein